MISRTDVKNVKVGRLTLAYLAERESVSYATAARAVRLMAEGKLPQWKKRPRSDADAVCKAKLAFQEAKPGMLAQELRAIGFLTVTAALQACGCKNLTEARHGRNRPNDILGLYGLKLEGVWLHRIGARRHECIRVDDPLILTDTVKWLKENKELIGGLPC